jgi:hypothetical protein
MKKCLENYNDNFQETLSRPGIIDARARNRAAARRLTNTALRYQRLFFAFPTLFAFPLLSSRIEAITKLRVML